MTIVLCFNWNTDKIPLCEKYFTNEKGQVRTDKINKPWYKLKRGESCYNPLFFNIIKEKIIQHNPKIVVISTEDDLESGTYFHSHFLIQNMHYGIKYDKINRNPNPKTNPEGNISYRLLIRDKYDGLRTSIYVKDTDNTSKVAQLNKGLIFNNNVYDCAKNNGQTPRALALYVSTNFGKFAFINVQVPHEYDRDSNVDDANDNIITSSTYNRDICLQSLEDEFIKGKNVDYVFLMGDFSNTYVIKFSEEVTDDILLGIRDKSIPKGNWDSFTARDLLYGDSGEQEDILSSSGNETTYSDEDVISSDSIYSDEDMRSKYSESDDFNVPTYSPQYRNRFRTAREIYNDLLSAGNNDLQRQLTYRMGYHNRIFYRIKNLDKSLVCKEYDTIYGLPMLTRGATHLGVLGVYEI